MVTYSRFRKILALLFLCVSPSQGNALAESLHFIGRYDFSWADIPLAAAELSIVESKDSYQLHLILVSGGIVNIFTRHRSDTMVSGVRSGMRYMPRLYESRYWTKNKPRHVKLVFDEAGKITQEINEPPEDRTERPEVPHSLKDGSIDPLTVVRAIPAGELSPRGFDAKRLYQGQAVKGETAPLQTYKGDEDAVAYSLSRTPLAGMTQKEMRQYQKGEPVLTFYFSAEARHIPLYMRLPIYMSGLTGVLTKECVTWDECKVN